MYKPSSQNSSKQHITPNFSEMTNSNIPKTAQFIKTSNASIPHQNSSGTMIRSGVHSSSNSQTNSKPNLHMNTSDSQPRINGSPGFTIVIKPPSVQLGHAVGYHIQQQPYMTGINMAKNNSQPHLPTYQALPYNINSGRSIQP